MPVTIKIPTPLRRHANQAKSAEVAATTAGQALEELVSTHPAMRGSLFDESGAIKPFVRVFVGATDIADLDGPATALKDGDVISLVPPVAGA
jgi:molybdopterin converting factor small subunit